MLSTRGWMTDGGIWKTKYGKLYSKEKKPSTAKKLTILKTPIPVSGGISLIKSRADLQTRLWLVDNEAGNVISGNNLAKRLNEFYISTTSDLSLLDLRNLPAFLPAERTARDKTRRGVQKSVKSKNSFKIRRTWRHPKLHLEKLRSWTFSTCCRNF